jgi:CRP/FNR family cyclic AMP-dependent transcriptional regulator
MHSFDPLTFAAQHGGAASCKFRGNQTVYAQGDAADSLFYIEKGKVRLTVVSEHGKEAVVAMLEASDFFGEGCLTLLPLRMSTATTITECVIARLDKACVVRALHDDLPFSELMCTYLLTQNTRLQEQLVDHLFNSSEKRLARILLLMANYGRESREDVIIPKIDQQTLAKIVGTTRPRISHFMNKFRKLGLIEYNGHIKVRRALLDVILHDPALSSNNARDVQQP